jgi:hypothetical protein
MIPNVEDNRSDGNTANAHDLKARKSCIHIHAADVIADSSLGDTDLLVIDTPDAALVANRVHSEKWESW